MFLHLLFVMNAKYRTRASQSTCTNIEIRVYYRVVLHSIHKLCSSQNRVKYRIIVGNQHGHDNCNNNRYVLVFVENSKYSQFF